MPFGPDNKAPLADAAAEDVATFRDVGSGRGIGRKEVAAGRLQGAESLWVEPLEPGDFPGAEPFRPNGDVPGFVPIEPEMEMGVEAVVVLGPGPAEIPDGRDLVLVRAQGHGLETDGDAAPEQPVEALHERLERPRCPSDPLVGLPGHAVDRHFDVPGREFLEEADVLVGDERRVREEREEQPLAQEGLIEIEEVVPCLLYTSPSPRDGLLSRMPSSA